MKKLLFIGFILVSTVLANAQDQDVEPTCYQKYAKIFEKRGAYPVEDGTYTNVIITIRKGSDADCFYGKVVVKNGKIDVDEIYLSFEDDTYEKLVKKYKYDTPVTIINGISKTLVTVDDELINVLFVKNIKPKKKAYKRAADPDFDL
jgi:hypothetical protein